MKLRLIDASVTMQISEEIDGEPVGFNGDVAFHSALSDDIFYVSSMQLFRHLDSLNPDAYLKITFSSKAKMYQFKAKAINATSKAGQFLVLIEMHSEIEEFSRRKYPRDELVVKVSLFGLPETDLNKERFNTQDYIPVFTCKTFDIGAGGMCLVSNDKIISKYGPYYLLEFILNGKDTFVLPAKMVRQGNCPQTSLYRYDYGICFLFDQMPEEQKRLTRALFNAKVSLLKK